MGNNNSNFSLLLFQLIYKKPKRELGSKTLNKIASYCQEEKLALQVIQYFLCTVIDETDVKLNEINCWWDMNDPSQEFLYEIFRTSLEISSTAVHQSFNEFFSRIASALQKKVNMFLWHFCDQND